MVSGKAKGQTPTSAVKPELRHQGVCPPVQEGQFEASSEADV